MDSTEFFVLVTGIASILFIVWYFFGEKKRVSAAASASGVQEIKVVVKGGYEPDVIVVRQNQPVRIDFFRDETAACSEQVVFRDFGISKTLPAFQTTSVEFLPKDTGEFPFTCGMNMMRGRIVVEARE